jgi:uncharacterized membrane protein (UPF0127 family)
MSTPRHFLEALLKSGEATHKLVNGRTGVIVADTLELAADSASRNKGLLGRTGLADQAAMIIAPCNAIHTFFMRFTIDVVFVNRQGEVLKLVPNLRPWRVGISLGAFAAIELSAGSIGRAEIQKGDRLAVRD